jgi:hypothetical protein
MPVVEGVIKVLVHREAQFPKLDVVGSNPIARSRNKSMADSDLR